MTRLTPRIHRGRSCNARGAQRGVVLFIALIVLVALALAGVGLMRSVTGGVLVAGNLAIKQSTTAAAEIGTATARADIFGQPAAALQNDAAPGYFAAWDVGFDAPSEPEAWWAANARPVNVAGTPYDGWDIRYVIHRMCANVNTPITSDQCVQLGSAQRGEVNYSCIDPDAICNPPRRTMYRVTTRVVGPKSTMSFIQSFVY